MTAPDWNVPVGNLIGGMPIDAFDRDIREKEVKKFDAAFDSDTLEGLFSVSGLEALIGNETILMPYVDVFIAGRLVRLSDMQRKSGKTALEVVTENFRGGATIRVREADQFDSRLGRLAQNVRGTLAAQSQINVYLTPPGQDGFPPHFDTTDVFIVQCAGSKEWTIYREYANQTELPLADVDWDPDRFKPTSPGESVSLRQGDVLYLPRGAMHEACCTDRESMHLAISVAPLTYADLLAKALRRAAQADIELRRRIPWPPDDKDWNRRQIASRLEAQLDTLRGQVDLDDLLRSEHPAQRTQARPALSGPLQEAIARLVDKAG
jgi:ribosomal protein L16 Arg81 hydroxylase